MLSKYEEEVEKYISLHKEEQRREKYFKGRSKQEYFIWKMLYENMIMSYENEIKWIEKVREGLSINLNMED